MMEDRDCYATPLQRELIKLVASAPFLQPFFLAGGTCLSVFYLHHRISHDLDFFTVDPVNLVELAEPIRHLLQPQAVAASAPHFLSCVVRDVKVDFVMDPLSSRLQRPKVLLDQVTVTIDHIDNLRVNKLCAVVSRTAPRDVVDWFVLYREAHTTMFEDYTIARQREALLDDEMYVAEKFFWIADEADRLLAAIRPDLRTALEAPDLARFARATGELLLRSGPGQSRSRA